ncbi:MAG: Flp pilus assembly protein CpaB [Planctomycetota bacterium]|jgi:pilus assembly protein CpaB
MRARSIALLLLALGCGLVASIGITQVIGNKDAGPPKPTGDTNTIFVALEDIPFGKPLTPEVLRLEEWPKDKVPAGALSRIEDVEGRRPRTDLFAGEPILENRLSPKGASGRGVSRLIPKGYRVVSVRVDNVSGSGLILPDDRVDVLLHVIRNPAQGIPETSTRTILQDVKVFAVNNVVSTEGQDEKTITAQTISLLVSPQHAQMVMLAGELGKIRLIMRSQEDDGTATVQDTTPGELLDASEAGDRQKENLLAGADPKESEGGFLDYLRDLQAKKAGQGDGPPSIQQTPAAHQHRMRIVSGPEVKEVLLERDEGRSSSIPGLEVWRSRAWNPASGFGGTDASTSPPAETVPEEEPGPEEENVLRPQPEEKESE